MATRKGYNPRESRLQMEQELMRRLHEDSDTVRVEPVISIQGRPPERYIVTFLCRGIVGIDPITREPRYGDEHQVEIYCDSNYPSNVPDLRWLTEIWHPNIHHESRRVCTNAPEWLAGLSLVDLCYLMFQMVQYRNYHAEDTPPGPLDREVAKWTLEYAEPKGIIDKRRGVSVDSQPFYRPGIRSQLKIRVDDPSAPGASGSTSDTLPTPRPEGGTPVATEPTRRIHIREARPGGAELAPASERRLKIRIRSDSGAS